MGGGEGGGWGGGGGAPMARPSKTEEGTTNGHSLLTLKEVRRGRASLRLVSSREEEEEEMNE